jgi:hypothetical protein
MPVIGYLNGRSRIDSAYFVAAFHQGLREVGFVDKQNVLIESRFAEGHFDRIPDLAANLVWRRVDVFVATGGTVVVAKAKPVVPATIPIVFAMGGDPVKVELILCATQDRTAPVWRGFCLAVRARATHFSVIGEANFWEVCRRCSPQTESCKLTNLTSNSSPVAVA